MTRFVLTGKARSATRTMFDTLKTYPGIYMRTGVFDMRLGGRFIREARRQGGRAWLDQHFWGENYPCMGIKCLRPDELALWPLLAERDVKTILLIRNPISCMVSHRQAGQDQRWHREPRQRPKRAAPVVLPVAQAVKEIRNYEVGMRRVRETAHDMLEVSYEDIAGGFQQVLWRVSDFLGLAYVYRPPAMRKLRPGTVRDRIGNFSKLREELPAMYRHYLLAEELT